MTFKSIMINNNFFDKLFLLLINVTKKAQRPSNWRNTKNL